MKKLILVTIILFISIAVISQSCLPEGITFSTQAQIDNFQADNPGCNEIEGDVTISGDDITNLNGLNVVTAFMGQLWITDNPALTSLSGLENVTFIPNHLGILNNDALTSLSALENLTYIGSLDVQDNALLSSLSGLDNVTSLDNLFLSDNPALSSLTGLENVTSIMAFLEIWNNDALSSLTALESLTSIGGLVIHGNALTSLSGLDNVTSIGGYLEIWSTGITSLTGLNNLTSISGDLDVQNNALVSLAALENLTSLGGYLEISEPSLTSLTGLEGLTSIGNHLIILGNSSLTSLTGLDNVTSIGGDLWVASNYTLTSLSGLDNIEASSIDNLYLFQNTFLSTCEVKSICDYLAAPSGTIEIHDNAIGCNSQVEVEEACDPVSMNEIGTLDQQIIHPNPFITSTTIEYKLKQPEKVALTIYDHLGKQVYRTEANQPQGKQQLMWNAEGYAIGIYFYRLQVGDAVASGKLVKVSN